MPARSTSSTRERPNLLVTIPSPMPHRGDQFGSAVAVAGENLLVGAELDDTGAPDTGGGLPVRRGDGGAAAEVPESRAGGLRSLRVRAGRRALRAARRRSRSVTCLCLPAGPPGRAGPAYGGRRGSRWPARVAATVSSSPARSVTTGTGSTPTTAGMTARARSAAPSIHSSRHAATTTTPARTIRSTPRPAAATSRTAAAARATRDCGSGRCRVCDGCFLYPWGLLRAGIDVPGAFPGVRRPRASRPPTAGVRAASSAPARRFPSRAQTLSLPPVTR